MLSMTEGQADFDKHMAKSFKNFESFNHDKFTIDPMNYVRPDTVSDMVKIISLKVCDMEDQLVLKHLSDVVLGKLKDLIDEELLQRHLDRDVRNEHD